MYSFYKSRFWGKQIPLNEFEPLFTQATHWLNRWKRLYYIGPTTPEQESMALCAIAEGLYSYQQNPPEQMPKAVKIGSVSCSYAPSPASRHCKEKELLARAGMYLEICRSVTGAM